MVAESTRPGAADPALPEEELTGGHTTVVVRVGDTVRRPVGPWTPAVHALLRHLREAGFTGAPEVLGIDAQDREMLRFVPGEVGTLTADQPLAGWFRTAEASWAIGRWIRAFQQAQRGFIPDPGAPWRRAPGTALAEGQVVVHHDVSPYNTVRCSDGQVVVLDWDFARPGDPLEDLAWAAWHWAPLMSGTGWHAEYGADPGLDVRRRQRDNLAALIDGYGLPIGQWVDLDRHIGRQMTTHADSLEEMARTDPAFAELIRRDYADTARRDAVWWRAHGPVWWDPR